jgi:hypothetical protein
MMDAEMVGTAKVPKDIIIKIIDTVSDPFLITALVVVFLMYRLLRRNQITFDNSLKEVFAEMRKMSAVLTETVTTNKVLTDIIIQLKKKEDDV